MPTLKETIASPFKKAKKFLSKNKKAKDADTEVAETNGEAPAPAATAEDTTNGCTDAVTNDTPAATVQNGDSKTQDTPKEAPAAECESTEEKKPSEEPATTESEDKKDEA